jgi:hypothetical protein
VAPPSFVFANELSVTGITESPSTPQCDWPRGSEKRGPWSSWEQVTLARLSRFGGRSAAIGKPLADHADTGRPSSSTQGHGGFSAETPSMPPHRRSGCTLGCSMQPWSTSARHGALSVGSGKLAYLAELNVSMAS